MGRLAWQPWMLPFRLECRVQTTLICPTLFQGSPFSYLTRQQAWAGLWVVSWMTCQEPCSWMLWALARRPKPSQGSTQSLVYEGRRQWWPARSLSSSSKKKVREEKLQKWGRLAGSQACPALRTTSLHEAGVGSSGLGGRCTKLLILGDQEVFVVARQETGGLGSRSCMGPRVSEFRCFGTGLGLRRGRGRGFWGGSFRLYRPWM